MNKISKLLEKIQNISESKNVVEYYSKEVGEPEKFLTRDEFLKLCQKYDNELQFYLHSSQKIFASTYDTPVLASDPMGRDGIMLVVAF